MEKFWSDYPKTDQILVKFALKIPSNKPYFIDCCSAKFTPKILTKIPWNQLIFHEFVPENPAKFDFFLCNLSEALIKMTSILFPMIVQLAELFIAVVTITGSHA